MDSDNLNIFINLEKNYIFWFIKEKKNEKGSCSAPYLQPMYPELTIWFSLIGENDTK